MPHEQPISHNYTPKQPLSQLHINLPFINNRIILTIVDHSSKYGQAYLIMNKNANTIINSIIKFTSHHGIPETLITDFGKKLTIYCYKNFVKCTKLIYI